MECIFIVHLDKRFVRVGEKRCNSNKNCKKNLFEVIENCAKDTHCFAVSDVFCETPSEACTKPEEEIENKFCMCTLDDWRPFDEIDGWWKMDDYKHYNTFNTSSLPKDLQGCVYLKSKNKISNVFFVCC